MRNTSHSCVCFAANHKTQLYQPSLGSHSALIGEEVSPRPLRRAGDAQAESSGSDSGSESDGADASGEASAADAVEAPPRKSTFPPKGASVSRRRRFRAPAETSGTSAAQSVEEEADGTATAEGEAKAESSSADSDDSNDSVTGTDRAATRAPPVTTQAVDTTETTVAECLATDTTTTETKTAETKTAETVATDPVTPDSTTANTVPTDATKALSVTALPAAVSDTSRHSILSTDSQLTRPVQFLVPPPPFVPPVDESAEDDAHSGTPATAHVAATGAPLSGSGTSSRVFRVLGLGIGNERWQIWRGNGQGAERLNG